MTRVLLGFCLLVFLSTSVKALADNQRIATGVSAIGELSGSIDVVDGGTLALICEPADYCAPRPRSISISISIRLYGIDAPERDDGCGGACYQLAKDVMAGLVNGAGRLWIKVVGVDTDGRLVAIVSSYDRSVDLAKAALLAGVVLPAKGQQAGYERQMEDGRQAGRGFWSCAGLVPAKWVPLGGGTGC